MKKETIREFFNHFTESDLGNNISFSGIEDTSCIKERHLRNISYIFETFKCYINPRQYSVFISNLLKDLVKLHCCAVSSLEGSPCYLGRMALSEPILSLPKDEIYLSCYLKGDKLLKAPFTNIPIH